MPDPIIKIVPNAQALAVETARRIEAAARAPERETFSIALSGGSTPRAAYELLAAEPHKTNINWSKVKIYFGDERCVPPDHADSNYRLARESTLDHLPLLEENTHRIRGEEPPHAAAIEYGRLLKEHFGDGGVDLMLLGMGDDGHTASLFPDTVALEEKEHRCVANYVDRLHAWRVTMSAPF